jgi:hypothetical protein
MSAKKTRIMFIEDKSKEIECAGRIGRVTFSKTGQTIYYGGRIFQKSSGQGIRGNFFDSETGVEFWISGPKKDGSDRLFGRKTNASDVDDDCEDEYWSLIRK